MLDFNNRKVVIPIALMFILIVIIFSFLDFDFSDNKLDSDYNSYILRVSDADSIIRNQPVNLGGYQVGFVDEIFLDKNYQPVLLLKVYKNIELTTDSLVSLNNMSLIFSQKSLNITNGVESDIIKDQGMIYNSMVGLSFEQLLNLVSTYIKSKN